MDIIEMLALAELRQAEQARGFFRDAPAPQPAAPNPAPAQDVEISEIPDWD